MKARWSVSRETMLRMTDPEITALGADGHVVLGAHGLGEATRPLSLFASDCAAVRRVTEDRQITIVVFNHEQSAMTDQTLIAHAREAMA